MVTAWGAAAGAATVKGEPILLRSSMNTRGVAGLASGVKASTNSCAATSKRSTDGSPVVETFGAAAVVGVFGVGSDEMKTTGCASAAAAVRLGALTVEGAGEKNTNGWSAGSAPGAATSSRAPA